MELRNRVVGNMEILWSQLLGTISDYKSMTENKRKQYEYLKEQDDAVRADTALFPKQQSQLLETIDNTKGELDDLTWERGERITELKDQLEQLNKAIWDLRSKIRMAQVTDAIQLKRLSVISNGVKKVNPDEAISTNITNLMFLPQGIGEYFRERYNATTPRSTLL